MSPVSKSSLPSILRIATLQVPGETELGSAGTQPSKGYLGRRCAKGAREPLVVLDCRGLLFGLPSRPLDTGAMPLKIQPIEQGLAAFRDYPR